MIKEDWQLKQIADFFYLLVDVNDATGKDILQKRFKKELVTLNALYDLVEKSMNLVTTMELISHPTRADSTR